MINLFYSDAAACSAEPTIGSHLAYHTDPQGNQNDTVTQERLQFFGNEIRTNRSRGVLENKILSESRAENFEWSSCMDNISSKSCSTICQCEV